VNLADNRGIPYPLPKRIVDKFFSGMLLVLVSPIVLAVLAAFALDMLISPLDRGSVLYGERRISKAREFELLKFRTLHKRALADMRRTGRHARLLEADPSNLTWTGRRILKPWYLDEIPQLLNVLRGDISLVGPRPWPPEMVERQVAQGLTYRNEIMAGLTGPAQVSKGSESLYADLDLEYVERAMTFGSWALVRYDLQMLLRTIAVMARGEGLNF
jgi:lipopolysaccharide/colanic/teichoic acid biosynthesis glycosyltransferase